MRRKGLEATILVENEGQRSLDADSMQDEESLLSIAAGPFAQNPLIPPYRTFLSNWSVYHDFHVNADAPIRHPAHSGHLGSHKIQVLVKKPGY